MTKEGDAVYTIAAVERDTGLSKDVLRVWERRYGFPSPQRDAQGERLYPPQQVERLRTVRRLMDAGHRPGRLLALSDEALADLEARRRERPGDPAAPDDPLAPLLDLIRSHRMTAYRRALGQRLARAGLKGFVQDTVAPLAARIGEAWSQGELRVHEEHLFTEHTERTLRRAIEAVPGGDAPRVLLTTAPQERHALGLLMVEATLALEGAHCISLGTQMPVAEIAGAALAHRADVVALSFSAAYPARQLPSLLEPLRAALPATVAVWIGGAGTARAGLPQGVERLGGLDDVACAVQEWRDASGRG